MTPVQSPVPAEVRQISFKESHGFSSEAAETRVTKILLNSTFLAMGRLVNGPEPSQTV